MVQRKFSIIFRIVVKSRKRIQHEKLHNAIIIVMNKNVGHAYINAVLDSQNRRPLLPDQSNILHSLFYARGKKRFILYTTDLGRIRRWQEHESSCLKLDASRRIYIDTCAMTLLSKRPSRGSIERLILCILHGSRM